MDQAEERKRREFVLRQIFEETDTGDRAREGAHRFTQDSPILSDVWLSYAMQSTREQRGGAPVLERERNLLINPFMGQRAGLVALELRTLTRRRRSQATRDEAAEPAPVAHLPGLVAASLTLDEVLRVALPSTVWWQKTIAAVAARNALNLSASDVMPEGLSKHEETVVDWMVGTLPRKDWDYDADRARREFVRLVNVIGSILLLDGGDRAMAADAQENAEAAQDAREDALAMAEGEAPPTEEERRRDRRQAVDRLRERATMRLRAFRGVYEDWTEQPSKALVWNIALNRSASLTSRDSRLSIKADAGERLFHISCSHLTWAVIDSGIDIRSPAFRDWKHEPDASGREEGGEGDIRKRIANALYIDRPIGIHSEDAERRTVLKPDPGERGWRTRVVARYDFTDMMRLLDISVAVAMRDRLRALGDEMKRLEREDRKTSVRAQSEEFFWDNLDKWARTARVDGERPGASLAQLERRGVSGEWMGRILRRLVETACLKTGRVQRDTIVDGVIRDNPEQVKNKRYVKGLQDIARWRLFTESVRSAGTQVEGLINRLELGLELDWSILEEFLIDMTPDTPPSPHGTQVAGILAADWRDPPDDLDREAFEKGTFDPAATPPEDFRPRFQGVCPDIRLIDLRVSDDTGAAQEFEAIAALQFILHLNARSTEKTIHGANISLSIPHDVRNYGCGKTRICEACEQLVASGVVVVAPAGNGGTVLYENHAGAEFGGFQSGSITDPGNAESIITVGATHAIKPHQYGVSYFSGRGPTGDGRLKPDLVAPGEKIRTAGHDQSLAIVDGTSFAAPHVSGAAALIMARYSELVGQPERIKEVLCSTATDLGRDRNFQGSGMLDALRALQSL